MVVDARKWTRMSALRTQTAVGLVLRPVAKKRSNVLALPSKNVLKTATNVPHAVNAELADTNVKWDLVKTSMVC